MVQPRFEMLTQQESHIMQVLWRRRHATASLASRTPPTWPGLDKPRCSTNIALVPKCENA